MFICTRLLHESFKSLITVSFQIERLKHSLMNAESVSEIRHRRTLTLIKQRPSQDAFRELQKQNDHLAARIQQLEITKEVNHAFDCIHNGIFFSGMNTRMMTPFYDHN